MDKESLKHIADTQKLMSKSVTQFAKIVSKRQQGLFIIYPVAVANLQLPWRDEKGT